jgi:hypothetical protein
MVKTSQVRSVEQLLLDLFAKGCNLVMDVNLSKKNTRVLLSPELGCCANNPGRSKYLDSEEVTI